MLGTGVGVDVSSQSMNRRTFLKIGAAAAATAAVGNRLAAAAPAGLPEATAHKLPRWRGFNLLEKFTAPGSGPFLEQDFEWPASWGFNFVRLPMDYRCWAKTPESEIHEPALLDIDQAVAWGKQYGVHVNLNFHRGPGYCVNPPKEKCDLWSDPAIQEQFARHWSVFAKRYRGAPNRQLSFDLINEPPGLDDAKYAAAMKPAIEAIRALDPQRLIIADGLAWGSKPSQALIPFGIAQSTRGYAPMEVSHYQASWIGGADKFPVPVWPVPVGINCHLFGSAKPEFQSPLTLRVQCPQATGFGIRVGHVSAVALLVVRADGEVVLRHLFKPGPGAGEWKKSAANEWGSYNADYDIDLAATIPAGTREIRIGVDQGDWLTFSSIRFGGTTIEPSVQEWGEKQDAFAVDASGAHPVNARYSCSKETLWNQRIKPWLDLAAKGVGVHVGEWGAFNHTPHDVALAWMRDCLENWKTAGFGWALWNFRGAFGVLDSGRQDVSYENFHGHKLDRRMLDLLRSF